MFHKIIYLLGVRLRSPEIIEEYKFLKESEGWSLNELEDYQLQQLKRMIDLAYEKSPYYQKLFKEKNLTADSIKKLEDIKKFPIVNKSDLIDYNSEIQNKRDYRKMFYSETSGSSGEPLTYYKDSVWDARTRAVQLRGYSWYGVNPWERNGYFWGFSFDNVAKVKTKILDFLMNRFRLFSYKEEEMNKFLKKMSKATYIEGYSSMIYEVAKSVNKSNQLKSYDLKMVKGTSEKVYDHYQDEVIKAFGKKMINEYGSAETGIIAYECPYGNMHISMENVIVEVIKGEIIVTNLFSDSFPIIRYRLGDAVKIDNDKKCECGMQHQILTEVEGRVGKLIHGYQDSYPSLTMYYIFKNMVSKYGITLNYQAIQKKKGKMIINLEQSISKEETELLLQECKHYFNNDLNIDIKPKNLNRLYDEKFKDFITHID